MDRQHSHVDTQECLGFTRSVVNESDDALIIRLQEEELLFRQTMELANIEVGATIYEHNYIIHNMRRRLIFVLQESLPNESESNKMGWDRRLINSNRTGEGTRLREEELLWEEVNILSNSQFGCTEQDRQYIRDAMKERILNAMSKKCSTAPTDTDEIVPSTPALTLLWSSPMKIQCTPTCILSKYPKRS